MTDREIWEQLAGVMGMLLEAEELQVAMARCFHERFRLVEARLALLSGDSPESLPEAVPIAEFRQILARQESRHDPHCAVLADLKRLISRLE
jgi:hypothetical protein